MAIRFDCPSCKANYEVADDLGGKMIMCRVCKKRGSVNAVASAGGATSAPAGKKSLALSPSRRKFLKVGIPLTLASVVAIATGALLAQRPWARYLEPESDRRGRGFGPPGGGKGDKGGPRRQKDKGPPPEKGKDAV
jgi:hypothetical protein